MPAHGPSGTVARLRRARGLLQWWGSPARAPGHPTDGAWLGSRHTVLYRSEPPIGGYSLRSDSIGFTPLARRAGTQLASAPIPSIISDIAPNTSGSTARTS